MISIKYSLLSNRPLNHLASICFMQTHVQKGIPFDPQTTQTLHSLAQTSLSFTNQVTELLISPISSPELGQLQYLPLKPLILLTGRSSLVFASVYTLTDICTQTKKKSTPSFQLLSPIHIGEMHSVLWSLFHCWHSDTKLFSPASPQN